jgi:hypothetical protein
MSRREAPQFARERVSTAGGSAVPTATGGLFGLLGAPIQSETDGSPYD